MIATCIIRKGFEDSVAGMSAAGAWAAEVVAANPDCSVRDAFGEAHNHGAEKVAEENMRRAAVIPAIRAELVPVVTAEIGDAKIVEGRAAELADILNGTVRHPRITVSAEQVEP